MAAVALLAMVGSACKSKRTSGTPIIGVAVESFAPGLEPPGFHGASAVVLDPNTGSNLEGATITINGRTLSFQSSSDEYEGDVPLAPGERVNVSVRFEGETYTGTGEQFADYPAVVSPAAGEAWHEHVTSAVHWSLGTTSLSTPGAGTSYTFVGVADADNLDGPLVWPSGTKEPFQVNAGESYSIQDSLSPGRRLVVVAKEGFFSMGGAAHQSLLIVVALGGQAVTVSGAALSALSVLPSPAVFPFRALRSGFVRAMGHFSDGTIQEMTELVTWSTADPSLVTIGPAGEVVATDQGTTTLIASFNGVSTSVPLTIAPPIIVGMTVGPEFFGAVNRLSVTPFTATGRDQDGRVYDVTDLVIWSSSDTAVATVSNAAGSKGLVTALSGGTVRIEATLDAVDAGVPLNVSKWAIRDAGTSATLHDVVWAGTQFVAGGDGVALTSPDGLVWTSHPLGVSQSLLRLAWSGSGFVGIGDEAMLTSPDGVTWTAHSIPPPSYRNVATSGSRWVGVSAAGISSSEDGATWTLRSTSQPQVVAWAGTQFVARGGTGVFGSPDGLTWTQLQVFGAEETAMAWSGTRLVAVGFYAISTSTDGTNWTVVGTPVGVDVPEAVTWNGQEWLAVGSNAYSVATSADGLTWASEWLGASSATGVASSGTRDVAVGSNGVVLTRP